MMARKKSLSFFKARFYLILSMAIVGSSLVVGKIIASQLPIFLASAFSLFLASFIFVAIFIFSKDSSLKIKKKDFFIIFCQAFLGTFLYRILLLYGLKYSHAAESGIITSTLPAVVGFFSVLILKEKMTRYKLAAIIFSAGGILIVNIGKAGWQWGGGKVSYWGLILIFASVLVEALFNVFAKLVSFEVSALQMSAWITLISFFLFLPFAVYEGLGFDFTLLTLSDWVSVFYYGIVVTVISYLLWFEGLSEIEVSASGIYMGVIPIASVILSYLVLGEQFAFSHLGGILFVILGIVALYQEEKKLLKANS